MDKNLLLLIVLALVVIIFVVAIVEGYQLSKTAKGRKIHDKLEAYNTVAKAASTVASKQDQLDNKAKKAFAMQYAKEALEKLGLKGLDVTLLSGIVEKAYQELFKTFYFSYNVGLSTNTDGSEKDAFKDGDKNGVPDFLEDPKPEQSKQVDAPVEKPAADAKPAEDKPVDKPADEKPANAPAEAAAPKEAPEDYIKGLVAKDQASTPEKDKETPDVVK